MVLDDRPRPTSQEKSDVAIPRPLVDTDVPDQLLESLKKMNAIFVLKLIDVIN